MKPYNVTPRMRKVLAFVALYIDTHGIAPTYDEIAEGCGVSSKSQVHRAITSLAERGHIRVLPGRARSIVLSGRHSLLNALGRPHESALMLLAEAAKADPLDILRDLIDDAIVHKHVATQSPETHMSRKEPAHV